MSNLKLQQKYQQNYLAEIDNIDREYQGGYISVEDADEFKAEALLGLQVALESAQNGFSTPEQYLAQLEEAVAEGYFDGYDDDDEVNYNSNDNMANFSSEVEDFSDVLLLGLLNVYGEDRLEQGVKDLSRLVGVSEAYVVDWLQGNDVPDLEETDLIAEAFEVNDDEYLALQELAAYERGEDLADYLYDDGEDNNVLEDVVDVVETVNDKAEYALAKINQAEFNSAVVTSLNDILDTANTFLQEGYITPKEYTVVFSDIAEYNNEGRLAMFSEYCNAEGIDEVTGLDRLGHFLKTKEGCGKVLNYTQYSSNEIGNAEFSQEEPDDAYYRQFARQYVLDELQFN
jgi:transcriptional regulator with XRE-family HTH domain